MSIGLSFGRERPKPRPRPPSVAAYVGFATLLEDSARRTILPIGRRGPAREAFEEGLNAQLTEPEHEAGVREQL